MESSTIRASERAPLTQDQYRTMFWLEGPPKISPLMQEILTKYSKIPEDEVTSHLEGLRERAWEVHPYPCIGRYRFLAVSLAKHQLYDSHILKTLKQEPLPTSNEELASPLYLELGVCFGGDLRALLYNGVPAARVYGADIEPKFIEMGYELFRDSDRFPPSHQFGPVDLFDKNNFQAGGRLEKFLGKVDILHLTSVFHLWSLEKQIEAARNVMPLMRWGGVILGCQTACTEPTEYPRQNGGNTLRHNSESWADMWMNQVAKDGVIEDSNTSVKGATVKVYSELIKIDDKDRLGGRELACRDGKTTWVDDTNFRWMRYEVWIGQKDGGLPQ